jgi:hypothetical protein
MSAPSATLWLVATGAFRGMSTLVGGVSIRWVYSFALFQPRGRLIAFLCYRPW